VSEESLIKEIMEEVENLQNSIVEYCPEVIYNSQYPSIKEMGDDMNKLIEHRIQLLTKYQEEQEASKQD
jgi:SOS-response transcriptional repressor LexA